MKREYYGTTRVLSLIGASMTDCIFCKIVAGEISSHKVYEDDQFLAFLDINPVNPGHTLVIPKKHYANLEATPADTLQGLIVTVKKVAVAVVKGTAAEGFNIGLNNGRVAGQIVDHIHSHIMPRRAEDGHELWHGKPYAEGQAAAAAEKIRQALA